MNVKPLLLAALLLLSATPAHAEPGDGDAPEHSSQATDVTATRFTGTVGGFGDDSDWYRVATTPGHAVRVVVRTATAFLSLTLTDDAGNALVFGSSRAGPNGTSAVVVGGAPGAIRFGIFGSASTAYEVELAHVPAADLAIARFEIEPMPVQPPTHHRIDPVTNGLQRRVHVTVENQGTLATTGVLSVQARGYTHDPIATLPLDRMEPGETRTFAFTWTATGAGDVTFFATLPQPSVDADLTDNAASRKHFVLVGGLLPAILVPTDHV